MYIYMVIMDFDPSRSDCVNSQPLETPLPRRNKMCLWRQFLGWGQDRQGGYGNQPAATRSCTTGPVIHGKRKIDKRQLRNWILLVKRVAFDLLYCTETKNLNVVNKCREKTAAHWICYSKKSSWLWPRQQTLRCNWTTSGKKLYSIDTLHLIHLENKWPNTSPKQQCTRVPRYVQSSVAVVTYLSLFQVPSPSLMLDTFVLRRFLRKRFHLQGGRQTGVLNKCLVNRIRVSLVGVHSCSLKSVNWSYLIQTVLSWVPQRTGNLRDLLYVDFNMQRLEPIMVPRWSAICQCSCWHEQRNRVFDAAAQRINVLYGVALVSCPKNHPKSLFAKRNKQWYNFLVHFLLSEPALLRYLWLTQVFSSTKLQKSAPL